MMINEDYFIKYLKNELTEEETRQLIAWVKEKKENRDFLFSLKDSYVYLNYENDCKEADTEHEWQKFAQRTGLSQQAGTPPKKEECVMEAFLPLRRCCRGRCLRGLAGQCLLLRYQFICGAGYSGNRSRTAGQDCAARWLYGVAERLFQTDLFIGESGGKHAVYSWREKRYSM